MAPRLRRPLFTIAFAVLTLLPAGALEHTALPNVADSVKLAVIGDNGTGASPQYEVGQQMAAVRASFPFDLVIMLGDNIYGGDGPADIANKFERPYAALLSAGVRFHAALGNHDDPAQRFYQGFGMSGERYYTFAEQYVRFFVLDTNLLDRDQVAWFESALAQATEPWKICYFHHPLYSNARRHGSDLEIRVVLEPLLVKHGVNMVLSGHDHAYERIRPQKGITYILQGASGQLRKGDIRPNETTAAAFDQDRSFTVIEITADTLYFQTISRTGLVVDSGTVSRRPGT